MEPSSGRINEIIALLKTQHKTNDLQKIPSKAKLNILCSSIELTPGQLDRIIALNSPVLRTIKGHVFETIFDYLLKENGVSVTLAGGDTGIDRIVNKHTLQLKTPTISGTNNTFVQYKTHKTHGAKSETESLSYYHTVDDFADFLVGLVTYSPLQILVINKKELPTHKKDSKYIVSPFSLDFSKHPGLNKFERIGINKATFSINKYLPGTNEDLPLSAKTLGVTSNIIFDTILSEENFRIWDMAIRGFAREVSLHDFLQQQSVKMYPPSQAHRARSNKADFCLQSITPREYALFQIKGATFNLCKFNKSASTIATETQLTRGRVNDHPTQSRLYLKTDFDYLMLCVDPQLSRRFKEELGETPKTAWEYFVIPTAVLTCHKKYSNRLNSIQYFLYKDIQQYSVSPSWLSQWEKES
ncbi:MAG: hypothetical protein HGA80_01505 [Candidatus Omnitrophica bacterium]|nr:hypothetical protein [Candidatus Omnitrophota bacterium]